MTTYEMIGIALIIIGLFLAGFEMMVPGFGIFGISAVFSLAIGVLLCAETVKEGVIIIVFLIVLLAAMFTAAMFWLRKKQDPWVLKEDVKGEENFRDPKDLAQLVGQKGISLTDLRPAGKGRIEGKDFEVLSDGMYIQKDAKIYVSAIHDRKIIVKEI